MKILIVGDGMLASERNLIHAQFLKDNFKADIITLDEAKELEDKATVDKLINMFDQNLVTKSDWNITETNGISGKELRRERRKKQRKYK